MTDEQLAVWLKACDTTEVWVKAAKARRTWTRSREAALVELAKRRNKAGRIRSPGV